MSVQSIENESSQSIKITKTTALIALLFLAPIPSIGVWFAAYGEQGTLGSLIWTAAKITLLLGPAVFWFLIQRQPIRLPRVTTNGIKAGFVTAILLASIIFSAYWFIARPYMSFEAMQSVLLNAGIDSIAKYILLVGYLTIINSLIEEYVFRWFFMTQLKQFVPGLLAVFLSAIIFTVHHTVILTAYLPWYFNLLASLGVFTGGLLWSYLYHRYQSIWPGYVSHIGADIGVFVAGYFALFVN
jgi:membrane protease YdiL (CAAX protease family)